jgi:hypothetical protein
VRGILLGGTAFVLLSFLAPSFQQIKLRLCQLWIVPTTTAKVVAALQLHARLLPGRLIHLLKPVVLERENCSIVREKFISEEDDEEEEDT